MDLLLADVPSDKPATDAKVYPFQYDTARVDADELYAAR
jgi:hypothetical protein